MVTNLELENPFLGIGQKRRMREMERKEKFERRETILRETYLINCRNGWYGKNRNGGILREKRRINLPPQPVGYIPPLAC